MNLREGIYFDPRIFFRRLRLRSVSVLMLLGAAPLWAGGPGEPSKKPPEPELPKPLLRTVLRVLEVDDAEALELLPRLRDPAQIRAALAEVRELIQAGRAEWLTQMAVDWPSASRFAVEPLQGLRYVDLGTWAPPGIYFDPRFKVYDPAKPSMGRGLLKPPPAPALRKLRAAFFAGPLKVKEQEIGVRFLAEVTLSDDHRVEGLIYFNRTGYLGLEKVRFPLGTETCTIFEPRFVTNEMTAYLATTTGEPLLLASVPALTRNGRMELYVVEFSRRGEE